MIQFVANPNHYVKLFLATFDGQSADMQALTIGQKYVWLALLAFARAYRPYGILNAGEHEGRPMPASVRRLADWASVGVGTVSEALAIYEKRGMIKQDNRRSDPCWEIVNWEKWQVSHGLEDCSGGEQEGVQEANTGTSECSGDEQQCSPSERQCSGNGEQCSDGEHLSSGTKRSGGEQGSTQSQGTQGLLGLVSDEEKCSGGERDFTDVKRTTLTAEEGTATSASQVDQARQILCTLLRLPDGSIAIDAALMAASRVHPRAADVLVQECGALAAREAQGGKPVDLQYLASNVRQAAERLEQEETLQDDDERLFVRLFGPRPRNAFWTQEQAWDRELVGFRRDREHWLYSHCATGCEEKLRKRAEECGLWDDGLIERVREKIMAGGYE